MAMRGLYEDGDAFAQGHSGQQSQRRQILSPQAEKQASHFPRDQNKGQERKYEGPILMKSVACTMLDPTRRSNDAREFENALRRKIVGQDAAIEKVAENYQMFLAGLNPPGRPVGNLLFLGPTGSGKTRVVAAMAESLFV